MRPAPGRGDVEADRGVGSLAAQLAHWGGATVIASVGRGKDLDRVDPAVVTHTVALGQDDPEKEPVLCS